MSRFTIPATIQAAPEGARAALETINRQLGSVPNLFRMVATSPATLHGYLGLNGALAVGNLSTQTRERLALAIAELNGCDYCLAAHNYLGINLAKLSAAEIEANRRGSSTDPKANAAVEFAVKVAKARGKVAVEDLQAVQAAGYSDAEIIEIIGHVALNTLTNYLNNVLDTDIDFPVVDVLAA